MRRTRPVPRPKLHLLPVIGLLALAGCGGLQWPPAGSGPGLANAPVRAQAPSRRPPPRSGAVTVRPGDSLYTIAEQYGVSVRALMDANRLRPPYRLLAGQRLKIPQARRHLVVRGDTLYGISRRYGVTVYALARANTILPPYQILTGQKLRIPYDATQATQSASAASAAPAKRRPQVRPKANSRTAASPRQAKPTQSQPRAPLPKPARLTGTGFIWPVRGRVVSAFGAKGKGLHNDGINIVAPRGTPVRASENGVVVYAGNELRGFGNLLLIKHSGGLITAYAHSEAVLVRRGERVQRGQIVARVGSSGNVASPQLHFEIRKGRQAIDPQAQLRPLSAWRSKSGKYFAGWNERMGEIPSLNNLSLRPT